MSFPFYSYQLVGMFRVSLFCSVDLEVSSVIIMSYNTVVS